MSDPSAETRALREEIQRERALRVAAENRAAELEKATRQERAARIAAEEHAREDAANFQEALRREKEEREQEKEGREQEVRGQTLHEYLAEIFRVTQHFPRLLTSPVVTKKSKTAKTKTTNHTTGRTDIGGKHYPLRLRPWADFPQLHEAAWARIEASIGQQRCLPSFRQVKATEENILEGLPSELLTSEYFLTESKTSDFIHETLQKPVSKILNAYLGATGERKIVFFDNRAAAQRSQTPSSPGSGDSQKPLTKTHPDCVVLRSTAGMDDATAEDAVDSRNRKNSDGGGDGDGDDDDDDSAPSPISRFAIGEHKPARRLRASVVSRIVQGPIPEDYAVQLAESRSRGGRSASRDVKNAQGTQEAQNVRGSTPVDDTDSGLSTVVAAATQSSSGPPNQVYFVYALTQAYHYMLTTGLEFGYVASGETLILLRILEDDCTTLLYHAALFPEHASTDASSTAIDLDTVDGAVFRRLAVAQLCSLCLLADEGGDGPRPVLWRVAAHQAAPTFPKYGGAGSASSQPPSVVSDQASSSSSETSSRSDTSSLGKRRRRDDNDGDDDNGHGGSRSRGRLAVQTHQPRVPSPLQQHESSVQDEELAGGRGGKGGDATAGSKAAAVLTLPTQGCPADGVAPPRRFRYCTQACLLGVAQGLKLDHSCPNVSFHKNAATNYNLEHAPDADVHPIPRGRFSEFVRLQLGNNLERDCACLIDLGYSGAIGYLFKITLTGFGYTFVAKGVEARYHSRLAHETRIYRELGPFQGRLIPVHLGLIKLAVEYPMVNFVMVTHMMLLSYAGLSLCSDRLERRAARRGLTVDWDAEAERTEQELGAAGLVDEDDNESNMMWCEDTQRAMRIDFDHAYVVKC